MDAPSNETPLEKSAMGEPDRAEEVLTKRYSRGEMEALRFALAAEQRSVWDQVYRTLDPGVTREYDGLLASDSNINNKKNRKKSKRKDGSKVAGTGEDYEASTSKGFDDYGFVHDAGTNHEVIIGESCDKYESIDYDDDEISDYEYQSILKPAFFVEGEPDFDSGPPLDGLEYLRRVRWEAAQFPNVKIAKLNMNEISKEQTPYMPKIPELPKCPPNLLPSKQWEDAFLADFSELRQKFSDLECSFDQAVNSSSKAKLIINVTTDESNTVPIPTVTEICKMDSVSRTVTLRNYIDSVESKSELSRIDCLWLFCLCASVDTPLHADTCASLRSLLRKCLGLIGEKLEMDDEVAMLTVLVTICGKYFGQHENV